MKKGRNGAWLLTAVFAVGLLLSPAMAGEEASKKDQNNGDVKAPAWTTIYSVRDAATGKLRPMTDSERVAAGLPKLLDRTSSDLVVQKNAAGQETFHLKGRFQSAVVIKRHPDGTLETTCVDSMDGVNHFVNSKKAKEVYVDK